METEQLWQGERSHEYLMHNMTEIIMKTQITGRNDTKVTNKKKQ